jgi:hypothetical protein
MFLAFRFFSSSHFLDFESSKSSAHLFPVETHAAMRDPNDRYLALRHKAFDASSRHIQELCNLIFSEQRIPNHSSEMLS